MTSLPFIGGGPSEAALIHGIPYYYVARVVVAAIRNILCLVP